MTTRSFFSKPPERITARSGHQAAVWQPGFSTSAGTRAARHALVLALIWPLLISAVFLPLAAMKFRNLGN
jgi:hypothetical protein